MSIVDENGNLEFRSDDVKKIDAEIEKLFTEIDNKYSDYFKSRPSKYPDEKYDSIRNHITTYTNNKSFYNFNFIGNSDLEENIKNEVILAFKGVLSKMGL